MAPSAMELGTVMATRSTREVSEDHLELRRIGDLETDLRRTYAADIVLPYKFGVFRGCDEIRESAARLGLQLPDARLAYLSKQVHEETAFLEWQAEAEGTRVPDGADSYLIRDGRIRVQTIRYTPTEPAAQ